MPVSLDSGGELSKTVDVYTDADAASNHLPPEGNSTTYRRTGCDCGRDFHGSSLLRDHMYTATLDPGRAVWGGWYS